MNTFWRKLAWLARRGDKEAELREELEFHLAEEAAQRQQAGMSAADARWAARRELGNRALVEEDTRASWGWRLVEQTAQDVRYGLRAMAANPVFSGLAILSLALGIGANTALFSFMDAILLRSLPVAQPEQLVRLVWHTRENIMHGSDQHDDSHNGSSGLTAGFFSYPAFEMFHSKGDLFSSVFGFQGTGTLHFRSGRNADAVSGEYVSGDYFSGLGVAPAAGRLLGPDDDRAGAASVAVLSYALSQRHFGGPAKAAGRQVFLNNFPFTIVGVAPPEFFGTDPDPDLAPGVFVPLHANLLFQAGEKFYPPASLYHNPGFDWVVPMARLRPGVSRERAQAVLAPQFAEFEQTLNKKGPLDDLPRLTIEPGAGGLDSLRWRYSEPLYILIALAGLILAICCANIANLMLARASARKREIAVRLSMGAGRWRVVRQLLTESVLLASIGGAVGLAFAVWGARVLTLLLAKGRENFTLRAGLNWHVLLAAAALAILAGCLFGLAPALQSTRLDLIASLKQSRAGGALTRARRLSLGQALTVGQIAVSLAILTAAGLFVRTLACLQSIDVGFNRENVLTFEIDAAAAGRPDEEIARFHQTLRDRLASIPGVRSATYSHLPLIGRGDSMTGVRVSEPPKQSSLILNVGPAFFSTMQIPILLGREVDERDQAGQPWGAVVNQAFVKQYFGRSNPLGRRLYIDYECPKCVIEVVGVCANARHNNWGREAQPSVYLPAAMNVWGQMRSMTFELRTGGDPLAQAQAAREIVRQADDRLPVTNVTTQAALIDGTINQEIVFARLSSAFALLALVIACVGLYGSVSYNVARRTGEIGIRMALGAVRGRVLWMVLREVVALTAFGLAISIPAALAASKLVKSFLFGIDANDATAFIAAAAILACSAIAAAAVPALRAARLDPAAALREE